MNAYCGQNLFVMNTILVPVDFSATSTNAAKYAFGFAHQVEAPKVVLYHAITTQLAVASDLLVPTSIAIDYESEQKSAIEKLHAFKESLADDLPAGLKVEVLSNFGSLSNNINLVAKDIAADLIVIGISEGGIIAEKILGSNATSIARTASVPVIIVPPSTVYTHVFRILLLSDFVDVETETPFGAILDLVNATKAQLFIANIAGKDEDLIGINHPATITFLDWLPGLQPEFVFLAGKDFAETANAFVAEKNIGLTLIVPKKHDMVETLFLENHTKKLAFHSKVPVAAVINTDI